MGVNTLGGGDTIPESVYLTFQMTFAIITPALISGAVVERMRFSAYMIFICLWSLVVYAPLCHMVWGGGWLSQAGALDFAGGTVVHISAGVSALVAAMVIGPRKEREHRSIEPQNIPFVLLGAALLWFGWFGFNSGSALAADAIAGNALVTTSLAASAALTTWALLDKIFNKTISAAGSAIGAVVGLVTITPAAGFVTPMSAIVMGAIGAAVSFGTLRILQGSKLDDSLDVFACHGMGGIVGSILTGVFATTQVNPGGTDGLLYGNASLMIPQLEGTFAAILLAAVGTVLCLKVTGLFVALREDDESVGLDLNAHAEKAYGYVGSLSIGQLALSKGMINKSTLMLRLEEKKKTAKKLGEILVGAGDISDIELQGLLIEQATA